ncbi:hypothetical protein [Arenibaculum sp.]|jgi:hypothetical protein|uniref:hypothetical protein n=1 Tax=Arenibaculum sp. TaxID=2865862 RepID=UPI002E111AA8|nr:hypothetical protein [Arenibaculum sp.]
MQALAKAIDKVVKPYGFALLVFPFGAADSEGEHRMNYISNARREEMLVAMKEFIAAHEGRTHDAPGRPQ